MLNLVSTILPRFKKSVLLLPLVLVMLWLKSSGAQSVPAEPMESAPTSEQLMNPSNESSAPWNLRAPTLGGAQFWSDCRVVGDWRIQQNSETGHYRLLEPSDFRHAWGTQAQCDERLDQQIENGKVKRDSGRMVILLHGLIRTGSSMNPLEAHFRQQGYSTINLRYASTRKPVEDHARALHSVIEQIGPEVTDIFLIGHSLGNIVIRRYLGDTTDPETGQQGDERIRSVVMLGPPNQGSHMARLLKRSVLFNTLAGKCGKQLGTGWEQLQPTLATPQVPFGIIAGGQDDPQWSNLFLTGKDDFTVSVDETKLTGASDFLVRPLLHSTMMAQPEVIQAAEQFFRDGYFVSQEKRHPLVDRDR